LLCLVARGNVNNLRLPHAQIEIREGDDAFAGYGGGTVFFMFNPFGAQTTEAILHRIHQSVVQIPVRIRIISVHPSEAPLKIFEATEWLKKEDKCIFVRTLAQSGGNGLTLGQRLRLLLNVLLLEVRRLKRVIINTYLGLIDLKHRRHRESIAFL
jgi:hypothetical protein